MEAMNELICGCGDHLYPHPTHRKDRVQYYCIGCDIAYELNEIDYMDLEFIQDVVLAEAGKEWLRKHVHQEEVKGHGLLRCQEAGTGPSIRRVWEMDRDCNGGEG